MIEWGSFFFIDGCLLFSRFAGCTQTHIQTHACAHIHTRYVYVYIACVRVCVCVCIDIIYMHSLYYILRYTIQETHLFYSKTRQDWSCTNLIVFNTYIVARWLHACTYSIYVCMHLYVHTTIITGTSTGKYTQIRAS